MNWIFMLALLLAMQGAQRPPQQTPEPPHGQQPTTPTPTPAQTPGRGGQGGGGGGFANAFPQHKTDPAAAERGKALYGANCTFCHGVDARGGSGGPSLIRSGIVLKDQDGELITPVIQKGIGDKMPALPLTAAQASDVAAFIHSFRVTGYDAARQRPLSIVVGDAKMGEGTFEAKCGRCHSVNGDLKGLASRFSDPRAMQQYWLMPGGGRGGFGGGSSSLKPTTATVTLPSGEKLTGRLLRMDDFLITIEDAAGAPRTFRRDGDVPKVEVNDPLVPHKDLLAKYKDKDIHDITAYLVQVTK